MIVDWETINSCSYVQVKVQRLSLVKILLQVDIFMSVMCVPPFSQVNGFSSYLKQCCESVNISFRIRIYMDISVVLHEKKHVFIWLLPVSYYDIKFEILYEIFWIVVDKY